MYSVGINVQYVAYDGPDSAGKHGLKSGNVPSPSSSLVPFTVTSLQPQHILINKFEGPSSFYVAYILEHFFASCSVLLRSLEAFCHIKWLLPTEAPGLY